MSQHRLILNLTLTARAAIKPHRAVSTAGIHVSTVGNEAFGVAKDGAKAEEASCWHLGFEGYQSAGRYALPSLPRLGLGVG